MKFFIDSEILAKYKVTPTEYYILFHVYKTGRRVYPSLIDNLVNKGYLEKSGDTGVFLTKEGFKIFEGDKDPDLLVFVDKYRELFRTISRKSGVMGDRNGCYNKFIRFFKQYPQFSDPDLILKAATVYIESQARSNFAYLQKAHYVIYKQDTHKAEVSRLAEYCEEVLNNYNENIEEDNIGNISV